MSARRANRFAAVTSAAAQDLAVRLMSRLRVDGDCWVWTGYLKPSGYGQVSLNDRMELSHVVAMFFRHGARALSAETVNHLCFNRACCNPDHLQFASNRENTLHGNAISAHCAAKTHCVHGHALSPENTYHPPGVERRECRECRRNRKHRADRYERGEHESEAT